MRVVIEASSVSPTPTISMYNPDAGPSPMVIMFHGLSGCKENNLENGYRLVREGFFVVSLDAHRHGEQADDCFKGLTHNQRAAHAFSIATTTSSYIDPIIRIHDLHPLADNRRIGLMGISLGGHVIYSYLVGKRCAAVRAAVPILSTPNWVSATQAFVANVDSSGGTPAGTSFSQNLQELAKDQPLSKLSKMVGLPLLMLNGENDPIVPIDEVRAFRDDLARQLLGSDLVELVEYPDTGHQFRPDMLEKTIAWFKKYV